MSTRDFTRSELAGVDLVLLSRWAGFGDCFGKKTSPHLLACDFRQRERERAGSSTEVVQTHKTTCAQRASSVRSSRRDMTCVVKMLLASVFNLVPGPRHIEARRANSLPLSRVFEIFVFPAPPPPPPPSSLVLESERERQTALSGQSDPRHLLKKHSRRARKVNFVEIWIGTRTLRLHRLLMRAG